MAKLPLEAFDHYCSLGVDRSYEAVAQRFGVSKVSVVKRAKRDHWQAKLREIERKSQEEAAKRAIDELQLVRERQLKEARFLQARTIQGMQTLSPEKAAKLAPALAIGWKHELFLLGEPTDRAELDVAELVKRESERWLLPTGKEPDGAGDGGAE